MYYRRNKLDSLYRLWDGEGRLVSEMHYTDSLPNGPYREFYPNGKVKTEGQYVKGSFDGTWLYYDDEGLIIGKGTFRMGNGSQSAYFSSGRIKMTTLYRDNLKDGDETYYYPDGRMAEKKVFEKGILKEIIKYPE
jgi:hypothetical protein